MRIAMAQMKVIPFRPEANVKKMLQMIDQARGRADLIVFPEMCVSGYLLTDEFTKDSFCNEIMAFDEKIKQASKGIAVAYGTVYLDTKERMQKRGAWKNHHPNMDGRTRKYNCVRIFQDGKEAVQVKETNLLPKACQPKTLLPSYRVFDDDRYFFSLKAVAEDYNVKLEELAQPYLINVNGKETPVGFELCEDMWCQDYRLNGKSLDVTRLLIENGARYICNLSSSPWTLGKHGARDRRVKEINPDVPYIYVNCVGAQNNGKNIVTFDGGSTIYVKSEPVMLGSMEYKEELIFAEDFSHKPVKRTEKPAIGQKYMAIIQGIRHFDEIVNGGEYVIGLSGGIDSSLVAALMAHAVGSDKILAVNLPSKYNTKKTISAAGKVAKSLGIKLIDIPIQELIDLQVNLLEKAGKLHDGALQTIAAKTRGTSILSNIARMKNGYLVATGNKWEIALGWSTLYGDTNGAFAPIGDLTKAEVFEMARFLNRKKEIIPNELIPDGLFRFNKDQIPPSPELANDQVDPVKTGYHDALIAAIFDYQKKSKQDIISWFDEGVLAEKLNISDELITRWGMDERAEFLKDLDWVFSCIRKGIFKRIQAPPIILTSKTGFGYDLRESLY